jgi:hypothetical protein
VQASGSFQPSTSNELFGDAEAMFNFAKGGNDTLTGGDNNGIIGFVSNELFGDARQMSDSAKGGNDILTGGDDNTFDLVVNDLFGDASQMSDSAKGGNDSLTGGDNSNGGDVVNHLVGDASEMSGSAKGGNDILTGGDNSGSGFVTNELFGDARSMNDSAKGGNDRLISGINATDQMWGDGSLAFSATGGDDTFVFAGAFGNDFVNDFHQDEDTLEFQVAGVADFSDLDITVSGSDTVISTTASTADTVTLVGFSGTLTANDFMFC